MANIAIYATKGFEYLLILGFLGVFTAFYLYFTSRRFEPIRAAVGRGLESLVDWFRVPEGVLFHQGHTWAQPDGNEPGVVRVGLDDFAQKMVGKADKVTLADIGSKIEQGEKGWSLRVGNKSIDMLSPVSGEIVAINKAFQENSADPYDGGWIYKVKPRNFSREIKNLLSGKLARKWMEEVVEKLRMKMSPDLGVVYQDGGTPVAGIARIIDETNWDKLAREFFLT